MDLNLANYRVVVTGSSQGIGKAIAETFLEEKAQVLLTGRDQIVLDDAEKELREKGNGKVISFCGDLIEISTLTELKKMLFATWGGIDTLICNLGSGKVAVNFNESLEDWYKQFEINLLSAVKTIKLFWDLFTVDSQKKSSKSIICISSICGYERLGCPVSYAAAKAGLNSFVKNMVKPCAEQGIRINVVSPGNIFFQGSTWEQKLKTNPEQVEQMLRTEVPLKRLGLPKEVADVVTFLASEKANFVTGANWVIDGGQTRSY